MITLNVKASPQRFITFNIFPVEWTVNITFITFIIFLMSENGRGNMINKNKCKKFVFLIHGQCWLVLYLKKLNLLHQESVKSPPPLSTRYFKFTSLPDNIYWQKKSKHRLTYLQNTPESRQQRLSSIYKVATPVN